MKRKIDGFWLLLIVGVLAHALIISVAVSNW
jgi:hypothetical protein